MPARSKNQQQVMGIAVHSPEKLYKKNRGILKMKKSDIRKYAKTKTTGLPETVKPRKRMKKVMPRKKKP